MGDPVTMALMAVKVGGGIMEARNAKKQSQMQAQSYERQAIATQIETEQAAGNRARQYADAMSTESAGQAAYGRTGGGGTGRALAQNQLSSYNRDSSRILTAGDNQAKELNQSASNTRTSGNMAMMSGYVNTAGQALGDYNKFKKGQIPPKGVKSKTYGQK